MELSGEDDNDDDDDSVGNGDGDGDGDSDADADADADADDDQALHWVLLVGLSFSGNSNPNISKFIQDSEYLNSRMNMLILITPI